jgi:protein-disulfide isomerase
VPEEKEIIYWISKKLCEKCAQAKEKFSKEFEKKYNVKYCMTDDFEGLALMTYYGLEFVPVIIYKDKPYTSVMIAAKELLSKGDKNDT